jgi:hypothetical protein
MNEHLFEFNIGGQTYIEKGKSLQIAYQCLMEKQAFSLSSIGSIFNCGGGEYEMTIPTIKVKKII